MGTELVDLHKAVTDQIKAIAPKRWVFLSYGEAIESIKAPTVQLVLAQYKRHPQSGINPHMRQVVYALNLMEPTQAIGKSDEALDDELIDLLAAIDQIEGLDWESADLKTDPSGQYLSYEISLTFDHNTSL